ncbi:MAG: DUF2007 domain-containing protein [Bacteroidales bacterium]|nr:DUF2007 domain-containing protein [Bacteroidales bacterium]
MEKDWILIYSNNQDFSIELAKGILTENGIEHVTLDKKDKFYQFGDFEIFVHRDNAIKAKFLLKDLDT